MFREWRYHYKNLKGTTKFKDLKEEYMSQVRKKTRNLD